jgi:hypothetical protein
MHFMMAAPAAPLFLNHTQISGLRNGDALASLARHGINCAAGDNTW